MRYVNHKFRRACVHRLHGGRISGKDGKGGRRVKQRQARDSGRTYGRRMGLGLDAGI